MVADQDLELDKNAKCLLGLLQIVVEASASLSDSPQLIEQYARRAVAIAETLYGHVESRNTLPSEVEAKKADAAILRAQLQNLIYALYINGKTAEADFVVARMGALVVQYSLEFA